MKKIVYTTLAALILAGATAPLVQADQLTTSAQENTVQKETRKPFSNVEMHDFKLLLQISSDTIYDPEHIDVFEQVYPAQTKFLREALSKSEASFASYEATGNLQSLKNATDYMYDMLDNINSRYNAYLIIFNDHAHTTKFGGIKKSLERAMELNAIAYRP